MSACTCCSCPVAQFINEDVIREEDDDNINQIQADNVISMNEKVDLEKQRKKEMRRVRGGGIIKLFS